MICDYSKVKEHLQKAYDVIFNDAMDSEDIEMLETIECYINRISEYEKEMIN
jgi:hypothetical protein